jgi:asparagine synthase (glutamine-hydrolysing)
MAHSLETRVPFMDNDLVNFAMQCPVGLKLNDLGEVIRLNENQTGRKPNQYFQKTNDGKQILREVMTRYITSEITEATKQGFSSPDASWFKGESIELVKKKLCDKNANIYEVLDPAAVMHLIKEHLNGDQNRRLLIWSLLNVEAWMSEYF